MTKRTLSSALTLSPAQQNFIGLKNEHAAAAERQDPVKDIAPLSTAVNTSLAVKKGSSRASRQQHTPRKVFAEPAPPETLAPLTTRLSPKTAEALRRAYLEQKLHRRSPSTQQEIIEAALIAWLAQHGWEL